MQKYQIRAFGLTFLCYAVLTACRNPLGIVKSTLHDSSYSPFDGTDGKDLLGGLDTAFLASYAFGLFYSGHLGDRFGPRILLSLGTFFVGAMLILVGLAGLFDIHHYLYFLTFQALGGLAQSTGWPGCVAIMTMWFGEHSRGLVFGLWAAHMNVGNIVGKFISSSLLENEGWDWPFYFWGMTAIVVAFALLFVVNSPFDVGLTPISAIQNLEKDGTKKDEVEDQEMEEKWKLDDTDEMQNDNDLESVKDVELSLAQSDVVCLKLDERDETDSYEPLRSESTPPEAISFCKALFIPGVIPYSFSLLFSKFNVYMFMFWLPMYLSDMGFDKGDAGRFSAIFDVGGFIGTVIAGYISDRIHKRAIVAGAFGLVAILCLYFFGFSNTSASASTGALLFFVGAFVSAPYTLISSAVAADLGASPSLKGRGESLSTVIGIIDGTGSIGGALQGIIVGTFSNHLGWDIVYSVMMVLQLVSVLLIVKYVYNDCRDLLRNRKRLVF